MFIVPYSLKFLVLLLIFISQLENLGFNLRFYKLIWSRYLVLGILY